MCHYLHIITNDVNNVNLFRWLNRVAGGTVKTACVLALPHCGSNAAVAGR